METVRCGRLELIYEVGKRWSRPIEALRPLFPLSPCFIPLLSLFLQASVLAAAWAKPVKRGVVSPSGECQFYSSTDFARNPSLGLACPCVPRSLVAWLVGRVAGLALCVMCTHISVMFIYVYRISDRGNSTLPDPVPFLNPMSSYSPYSPYSPCSPYSPTFSLFV